MRKSILLLAGALAAAAACCTATAQTPAACSAPEYAQFDFWIGDWEVHTAAGALAGRNRISKAHGGCVLQESYATPAGYSGQSINIYDARRGVWHQTWADSGGLLLQLEGGLVDGAMVLQGVLTGADGAPVQQRIRWEPQDDGRVRQHWQTRSGEGEWQTAFDGLYSKRKEAKSDAGDPPVAK